MAQFKLSILQQSENKHQVWLSLSVAEAQFVVDVGAIKDQRRELGYFIYLFIFFEGKRTHEDGFI